MDGAEIRALRRQLGLTQEEFAHEVGVTFATVNRWENGKSKPSRLALRRLATMNDKSNTRKRTRKAPRKAARRKR